MTRPPSRQQSERKQQPTPAARWRVWVVVAVLAVAFVGVLWKSARLQLVLGDDLRALAEEQYLRTTNVSAPRGAIKDSEGRDLAISLPAFSIFAEPRRIIDKEATAKALAPILGQRPAEVRKLIDGDRAFTWLSRRVAPDAADAARALDLPGVGLRKEWRRTWPNKELAAQVLGGVDIDGKGRGGVEQALDERLAGQKLRLRTVADNRGARLALLNHDDAIFDLKDVTGDDVTLTLELPLQQAAEEIVLRTKIDTNAKAVWAVVLDVRTGAIRALAQAPGFNPNTGEGDKRTHTLADAFEPGSIFKVATFAAALDADVVSPTDMIDCENGRYQLGRHTINDAHRAGVVTARDVFKHSSNIGTLKIAARLGEDKLRTSLMRYGIGDRPGTGLLDETAGRLPRAARWGETRLATVSFGHGLMVSSLQMASLMQAIANGGVRHRPYLIETVQSADGAIVQSHDVDDGERVMRAETAAELLLLMESVTEPGGTGTAAAIPGMRTAGKTGTAEKVDPVTGRYSKELNISSFLGAAPADDPRVVAIVVVDEPKGTTFGGPTAGPAWRAIVERALALDGHGQASLTSFAQAKEAGNTSVSSSLPKITKSTSPPRATLSDVTDTALPLDVPSEGLTMPDVRGLSARAALAAVSATGVELVVRGHGRVVSQTPAPGAQMTDRAELVLEYAP